jgi:hypothetical protein
VSAAATRDDLAAVVASLTDSAAVQRQWQAEYETKAAERASAADLISHSMYERFAAQARGTANGLEIGANMISKYVGVSDE